MRREVKQTEDRFLASDIYDVARSRGRRGDLGTYREPEREVPVYHRCGVLVVGGGPSGTAAALAAARTGADVTLLERYNHLGGLSTGGLVIWIDRMTGWDGSHLIRGFAEEVLGRLPSDAVAGPSREDWGSKDPAKATYWGQRTSAFHGTVNWAPTIDPERLKLLSQEMLLEAGVRIVYHAWAAMPIVEDGRVKGALFESKEGRQALLAEVVVDATGDGDMFARAGGAFEADIEETDVHHCVNTGFMLANVDMPRWLEYRRTQPEAFAGFMDAGRAEVGFFNPPYVSWRDDVALFLGPRQSGLSGLNVDDMTEAEIRSHRLMERHHAFYRAHAPGFENAYMMLSAPQLGVRHTRRLVGVGRIERGDWGAGTVRPDEVGVSPSVSPKFPPVSVPYGALVPRALDGLVACGRHVSSDANSHGFMREIPQCWLTGQAAGAAAGLAANAGLQPRQLEIGALQAALQHQGVYLRSPVAAQGQLATAEG